MDAADSVVWRRNRACHKIYAASTPPSNVVSRLAHLTWVGHWCRRYVSAVRRSSCVYCYLEDAASGRQAGNANACAGVAALAHRGVADFLHPSHALRRNSLQCYWMDFPAIPLHNHTAGRYLAWHGDFIRVYPTPRFLIAVCDLVYFAQGSIQALGRFTSDTWTDKLATTIP